MMDYNSYYPAQPGQPPPPPPTIMSNDRPIMGGQVMSSNGPTMMHSPAPSTPQSMRHTPGPPPMQHQQPPQQHMGHPMTPQQQPSPHPNYHQLPSHPPISHSASPHPSSTPQAQSQPPPRPATGPSPLHHQSPIHMNGPSPKIQAHGPMPPQPQLSNHMSSGIAVGPPHAPGTNHLPPHQQMHHGHNFSSSPMPPHHSTYGPSQPGNHHHMSISPMNHGPPPPPPPPMQAGPGMVLPPPPPGYMPAHPMHLVNQERSSPFYQHIPQTEFRIIELNKRLQSRPNRGPASPLPTQGSSDESNWWEGFVCDFFDDDSILTLRIPGDDKPDEYKISRTLIPRFFKTYFDGGVTDLSIKLRNIRETSHNPSLVTLDCEQADIITKHIFKQPNTNIYRNVVVHTEGHLSLDFVSNNFDQLMIKCWRFDANQCHEYIDRSMTNTGLPAPVTRFGLTKSTSAYLRMCMVMEPMQDLMAHHIHTKLDPKSCLKHILFDRYKVKSVEPPPNKRRKRKAPATTAAPRASPFSKKAKVNGANALSNNVGMNNNLISANDISGGLPLASQDVLVVGEPSMLGADFGDENERRITRLENNQYDSSMDSIQTSSISNNGNQMNQYPARINSASSQQNDLANQMSLTSNHDASGNNVQTIMGYTGGTSSNNHLSSASNDHGNENNNGMDEGGLVMSNNGSNCAPVSNDNSGPTDLNHQMNYPMNGETNHIVKSEMDMQPKQTTASSQVADSEVSRD